MDAHPEPDQRKAKPPDAAALTSVLAEAFETYREWAPDSWNPRIELGDQEAWEFTERLSRPDYWGLVAEADGRAVGYVVLRQGLTIEEPRQPIPGAGHIWQLFVRPAWWGSGLAARLLEQAVGEARRREYTELRLWTPRDNARARAFYAREGWRATGRTRYGPDLDLDLLEYRRSLAG
jgi:GNAT superfamily N-acetyltransferase